MSFVPAPPGDRRAPAVIVTVREVLGSAPREPGATMLVSETGSLGTIGGGQLEWRAMIAARKMLAGDGAARTLSLPLGPALSQCCGGHVVVDLARADEGMRSAFLARHRSADPGWPRVALFGAGHVGQAVARALEPLPCRLLWVDDRADLLPLDPPAHCETRCDDPATIASSLPPGCFVLVMTHSHPLDLELVASTLPRADLPWVGLIGSRSKRARFEGQLRARDLPEAAIARLVCPIGIAGIAGKEPSVIAVAAVAQLLIAFEAVAARASTGAFA